jgi:hypothetical protein
MEYKENTSCVALLRVILREKCLLDRLKKSMGNFRAASNKAAF